MQSVVYYYYSSAMNSNSLFYFIGEKLCCRFDLHRSSSMLCNKARSLFFTQYCNFNAIAVVRKLSQDATKCVENDVEKISKSHSKCRFKRLIKAAAREKGPFLEYNPRLCKLIEESRKYSLSDSSVEFSIKITLDTKSRIGMHEVMFPGKGFLVMQYETSDPAYLEHKIMSVCDPYDATLIAGKSLRHEYFDPKGVIVVTEKADGSFLTNKDQEVMLTQGVVSVDQDVDAKGKLLLVLYCDSSLLLEVKRNVQDRGYLVEEAYVGLIPRWSCQVPRQSVANAANLLLSLSEIPEIDRLYENIL